jgi:selenocysteine-specific elongation factor
VPARDTRSAARLPIDRVFVMKGFGTVVTGTLISGTVRKDEELQVFPTGRRVRVRGIQVHGTLTEQALAGQRTALNLAGVAVEDLARGMILAPPGLFQTTGRVDVTLSVLPSARPLRDRARVHLHAYTAETIAEVVLHAAAPGPSTESSSDGKGAARMLKPGDSGMAQLRLAEPMMLLPGDRFILRQFSPVITIGGGAVLDPAPLPRRTPELPEFLHTLASGAPADVLSARVARRRQSGLTLARAVAETGWLPQKLESVAAPLITGKQLVRAGQTLVSAPAFDAAKMTVIGTLAAFHDANPLVAGISKEELRERLGLEPDVFSGVLEALAREKRIEVVGEQVRAAGRGVVMKDEEAESKRQIEQAFATAGLKVPALKEVLAGLRVDQARAQKIVTLLLREKVLVKLSDELVFHRNALESLRRSIAQQKTKSPRLDVAGFKDLTGVTRKYAIPLLEYLDREHVTRRVGDERIIL